MSGSARESGQPFTVLFVCTANQCRSPLAEFLLRSSLAAANVSWNVSSSGTRAHDGLPMHPHAASVLDERGIDYDGWVSSRLDPAAVAGADLVLTAEVAHRRDVVTMLPAAVRRTFTLLQFALLLDLSPAGRANPCAGEGRRRGEDLIRAAEQARSRPQARDAAHLDIADPVGGALADFQRVAGVIHDAVRLVAGVQSGESEPVAG